MSVPPSDGPAPVGRRRIVMLPERALTPIALIAREGDERDALEEQLARTRPVVTFPSLAHFCTDSARKERWAGILLARTHAWDSRLDDYVPRRAFIALYGLTDEGYGWPDAVKRIASAEELGPWLELLASPVLPAEDKPRVSRSASRPQKDRILMPGGTRKERPARITVSLAPVRAAVREDGQLALPIATAPGDATPRSSATATTGTPAASPEASVRAPARSPSESPRTRKSSVPARPMDPSQPGRPGAGAEAASPVAKRRGRPRKPALAEQLTLEGTAAPSRADATSAVKPARASKASRSAAPDHEGAITRVALELGFARAEELLRMVRARARALAGTR